MDYRRAADFLISSIGIGTYLGEADDAADQRYEQSVTAALDSGINLIDTSLNYRNQRSEIAIGRALNRWFEDGHSRDKAVVCTKAGYLVPGAVPPGLHRADTVGRMHSLAPQFLQHQLERSLANLGLEAIDVWYVHNPETQLEHISEDEFYARLLRAFEFGESAARDGRIRYYGVATWDAFRRGLESVSLRRLEALARDIAGAGHRFRFVQLPFNLAMPEAFTRPVENGGRTVLDVASELGLTVVASASILQSRLSTGLPEAAKTALPGFRTDAQRALQFVRSAPGITSALVGMSRPEHVRENAEVSSVPPLAPDAWKALFA